MSEWILECNKSNGSIEQDCAEMVFLGDVALADKVGDVIQQNSSDYLFEEIPPEFFDVDILCYNLECCLSKRGGILEPKPSHLRGLPEFLSVFPKTRAKYLANLANNHFLDYGENAAIDTLRALRSHNMQYFGAVGSAVEEQHIILKTHAGDVGLIGFAPSAHSLPNMNKVNLAAESVSGMLSKVNSLKQQSDIVIVSLHQGVEYTRYVDRHCRNLSQSLVDGGADCIVCHHPHVIQSIETYNGTPIFHSIGNFVIDEDFRRRSSVRDSLALRILLYEKKLHKIIVEPFIITDTLQPRPATWQEKQQIRVEVEMLSSAFESKVWTIVNYTKCGWIKMYDRLVSVYEMIRQYGIFTTMKYYFDRIKAKAKHKVLSMGNLLCKLSK